MQPITKLDQHVREMKQLAVRLAPRSYPHVRDDSALSVLKHREIVVDGYTVVVHCSRSDYTGAYLDVITVTGKYMPFLPIALLCKIGEHFLGKSELTFGEFLKNGRKVYSWMVLYKSDGTPVSNNYIPGGIDESYNGLKFTRVGSNGFAMKHQVPPEI